MYIQNTYIYIYIYIHVYIYIYIYICPSRPPPCLSGGQQAEAPRGGPSGESNGGFLLLLLLLLLLPLLLLLLLIMTSSLTTMIIITNILSIMTKHNRGVWSRGDRFPKAPTVPHYTSTHIELLKERQCCVYVIYLSLSIYIYIIIYTYIYIYIYICIYICLTSALRHCMSDARGYPIPSFLKPPPPYLVLRFSERLAECCWKNLIELCWLKRTSYHGPQVIAICVKRRGVTVSSNSRFQAALSQPCSANPSASQI